MSNPIYHSPLRLWVARKFWKLAGLIDRVGDRMLREPIAAWEREILKMSEDEWDDVQRSIRGE